MQAVILAAGQSSRFWPFNKNHKSLFFFKEKPFLWYLIKNLEKTGINEVFIIQSPKRDIEFCLRDFSFKLKIKYLVQKKPIGTANALKLALPFLKERFLVLNGDDFYEKEDLIKVMKKFPSVLVKEAKNPERFGVIVPLEDKVKKIIEKPQKPPSSLVSTGCYFLSKKVFSLRIRKSPRGEYELPDYINHLIKEQRLYFVIAKTWIPLNYPWDLFAFNRFLLQKQKTKVLGKVEKGVFLSKDIVIEKGAWIKSGTYIEGPVYIGKNSQIGPNAYIRPFTYIEKECQLGHGVEVKNSIIKEKTKINHFSYIGDSIIGKECLLGAGTIVANLRLDKKTIRLKAENKFVNTGFQKLGAIIGKNTKIGVNVSLMPGTIIGTNCLIFPHQIVKGTIKDNQKI